MKNRIARIACLALIIAGVFFTTGRAEANPFAHSGTTGCMAPAHGDAIGACSKPEEKSVTPAAPVAPPAPKHWHYHPHWHFLHHYRHHHSHHSVSRFRHHH